ncbi:MAG: PspC domain-containing protein [Anaerolineaceae bacterium]|nr:PspC domain-containing protein [Anaerolineaceae bacterium]
MRGTMYKKLYRSHSNTVLGGICGGLGEYLGIDPTIVRIFFLLLLVQGIGFAVYIVLWIIIPYEEDSVQGDFSECARRMGKEMGQTFRQPNPNALMWAGAALTLTGVIFLLRAFNVPWLAWMDRDFLLPVLLIAGGAALFFRAIRGGR